jgi:hypothetical protein
VILYQESRFLLWDAGLKIAALWYGYQDSWQEQATRAAGKGFVYENDKGDM